MQKRHSGHWNFRCLLVAAIISVALMSPPSLVSARADLGAAANSVPSASLVGKGRLTFLGFKIFDAELYAPDGTYSPTQPFALKLTYLRNFKGSAIAKRSADEMRKIGASEGQLAIWSRQMETIFPNVSAGQSITGVRTSSGNAAFYLGNRKIGTISDAAFTKHFFSIWLGNRTGNPELRAELVGAGL
ncbi:chalcone isomerase family protein [uncultured Roseibium sp.]|uniref:chalcone isomerase family protein n=1 Tax=uncultured Roseibium sp. TaxID=1936171 RepID=UPI0037483517